MLVGGEFNLKSWSSDGEVQLQPSNSVLASVCTVGFGGLRIRVLERSLAQNLPDRSLRVDREELSKARSFS